MRGGNMMLIKVELTIFEDLFDGYWQRWNIVFSSNNAKSKAVLRSCQLNHLEIRPEVERYVS